MTQLGKLAILGIAKESTVGTYVAPTDYLPFEKAEFEDIFAPIKDESYRGNDSGLQGLYQGVAEADWTIDMMAYPQLTGYFLRGIIGPDTVVAGASTTTAASSTAGATSMTVTSATGITAPTVIRIGTGATQEYASVTLVASTTLTVAGAGSGGGLLYAHASGVAVVGQSTHSFAQSINPANRATFSFTVFDTLGTTSYSGAAMSDLDIKIDPKNACTLAAKLKSFQTTSATTMTPAYVSAPPLLGWQWGMNNAGAASTRGLSLDLKIKRKLDVIHSSDGIQSPREIFQGALDLEGSYKAVYENQTDLNLFLQYLQQPVTATLTQPVAFGGSVMTITTSQSGVHKGKRDWGKTYVGADFTYSAIYNSTDSGLVTATLSNFRSTAY